MHTSTAPVDFARRVVALYLLSCLAAVVLLIVGGIYAVDSMMHSRATGESLSRIGRLVAAVELDQATNQGRGLKDLVDHACSEGAFVSCAVVNSKETYLVHTDAAKVGTRAVRPVGAAMQWGSVEGIEHTDVSGRNFTNYMAEVSLGDEQEAQIEVVLANPSWSSVSLALAQHWHLAIVAPMVVVVGGGWYLRKASLSVSSLESQLNAIARLQKGELPHVEPLPPEGLASIGWNRVVARLNSLQEDSGKLGVKDKLQQRAAEIAGGKTRVAFDTISEGIAVTDPLGKIEYANRAVAMLLSNPDEVVGQDFETILRDLDEQVAESLANDRGNAESVAEIQLSADDCDRTIRVSRAAFASEATEGHVWTVRDVTQQRLAEESRDKFIDTATHELRTPLANIKAYAETLAMGDLADVEEQKEFCNTINSEATRLSRFVDDLLSISSIEMGSLGLNRQNVDLSRLLQEAADKVRPLIKQGNLKLEVSLSEKLGEAKLDKDKVAGMVVNLLGNAAKYTPSGGSVKLSAIRDEEKVTIAVTDTGVGIAEHEQERVFDKFFRSENLEVQDKVGTGLGLPLAREIARLHRGDLTLRSELGEGSVFTAILPVS